MSSSATPTAIIATNAIFLGISLASVGLRFVARRKTSSHIKTDDWLVVVAMAGIWTAATAITNIVGVPVGGLGYNIESLSVEKSQRFLFVVFLNQFFYIFAVGFVKLSVLYLYKRIFSATRTPTAITVLIVLTCLWLVAFFFATLLQDIPIYCNWVNCESTTNYPVMYIMSSVTDIALDLSILALPAFLIRRLHISRGKKIAISGVFALGFFCVVASIARLAYTVTFRQAFLGEAYAANFDVSLDDWMLWSGIEACVSTVCANLPCYSPLFAWCRQLAGFVFSYGSDSTRRASSGAGRMGAKKFNSGESKPTEDRRSGSIGLKGLTITASDDFDKRPLRAVDSATSLPAERLGIRKTVDINTASVTRLADGDEQLGDEKYYHSV